LKQSSFVNSGGGAATLGWSATVLEQQNPPEKMKIHLHNHPFSRKFFREKEEVFRFRERKRSWKWVKKPDTCIYIVFP